MSDGATVDVYCPRCDLGEDAARGVLVMTAAEVMVRWRVGSHDPPWSWRREIDDLRGWDRDGLDWVAAHYMQVPILPGPDGRLWDGHHRVVAAWCSGQLLYVRTARVGGAP